MSHKSEKFPTRQENVGEENKTNLLRMLFSSPTFSCLRERGADLLAVSRRLSHTWIYPVYQ
jgi:hypothetical protein